MALSATEYLATFDITSEVLDLSPVLALMLEQDLSILGEIGVGKPAEDTTIYWEEDSLYPYTVTQSGALDNSSTTLAVSTGHGKRVKIGSLLKDTTAGKTEVVQVTAISTDSLTITRGYGNTSGQSHSDGAVWRIISSPVQEGQSASADISQARIRPYNYTQIFERAVQITGSQQARKSLVVGDEMAHQLMLRLEEIKRELAMTVINGVRSANAGSDSSYRSFGGLIEALTYSLTSSDLSSSANLVTTSEELSSTVLNDLLGLIEDDGGNPNVILGSRVQIAKIVNFDRDKIQITPDTRVRGAYATTFLADNGWLLKLVRSRWVPDDVLMVLDTSKIKLRWYREMKAIPLAKTGDFDSRQIVGEVSLEVRNAIKAHAIHTNLTTT